MPGTVSLTPVFNSSAGLFAVWVRASIAYESFLGVTNASLLGWSNTGNVVLVNSSNATLRYLASSADLSVHFFGLFTFIVNDF